MRDLHSLAYPDHRQPMYTLAKVFVAASVGATALFAVAHPPILEQVRPATTAATQVELEQRFWACDRATTGLTLAPVDAMACSVVTEALKAQKFGGDFDAMLAWWRQSRGEAHRALASPSAKSRY